MNKNLEKRLSLKNFEISSKRFSYEAIFYLSSFIINKNLY